MDISFKIDESVLEIVKTLAKRNRRTIKGQAEFMIEQAVSLQAAPVTRKPK